MIRQAVILAGGRGSRLGPLTKNTPKPLLKISGKPFIEYLMWNLVRQGIKEIIIMTGFKSDNFIKNYSNKYFYGAKVRICNEEEPMGTAGCLTKNIDDLEKSFWVINGDSFFDCNLIRSYLIQDDDSVLILGTQSNETNRFGSIEYDKQMLIRGFKEKDEFSSAGTINAGIYIFHKKFLKNFQQGYLSMENDVFPQLVRDKSLKIDIQKGYFIDIGTPESFKKAINDFPRAITKPALFLDRDGTLNIDNGYTFKLSDLKFIKGAVSAIIKAIEKGFYIVVITNQGGISKGLYSEKNMKDFNNKMTKELRLKGANIDYIYFCNHHPNAINASDRICSCRKPKPGLINQALNELPINMEGSYMIGDKITDIEAGEKAGIKSLLFDDLDLDNFLTRQGVI